MLYFKNFGFYFFELFVAFPFVAFYILSTSALIFPFLPPCVLGIGALAYFEWDEPAQGWINTKGPKGDINTSGPFFGQYPLCQTTYSPGDTLCFYPGVIGFTGIQVTNLYGKGGRYKLLGYGLDVRLGRYRPRVPF
jgi:hypothetical protein